MGKKYIIEIGRLERLYKAFIGAHGKPDITWLSPEVDLTPYTEPNMEQVRKEAYDTAYADAEGIYDSGKRAMYQKGLKDAWEAARTLWNTPNRKEVFGHTTFNTVLTTLTAQETIEKIRQYEQEKEKEIQVGDEIEAVSGKAVVVYVDDVDEHKVRYVYSNGVYAFDYIDKVAKTGRHFPEIAAVLEKMQMKDGDNE